MIVRNHDAVLFALPHMLLLRCLLGFVNIMVVIVLAASLLISSTNTAIAQVETTELTGPRLPETLQGHIEFLLDPTKSMTLADALELPEGSFAPVEKVFPDFGYVDQYIWLRMVVRNDTPDIRSWRLHFRENFK